MMQDLRAKTKIVMIVVALAFVGLMVFDWGMDITGRSSNLATGEIGSVRKVVVSSGCAKIVAIGPRGIAASEGAGLVARDVALIAALT